MKLIFCTLGAALLAAGPLLGASLPVCERTQAVQDFIVNKINQDQGTDKTCAEISLEDLASLKRIAVQRKNIRNFKVGDFSDLPNLEILNIRSNPYVTLPEGLFEGLTNLHTLVIIATELRYLPDDFLLHTPNMKFLHVFRNKFRTISLSVLNRFEDLPLEEIDLDNTIFEDEQEFLLDIYGHQSRILNFR